MNVYFGLCSKITAGGILPLVDKGCNGFRAGKQLAVSCLHYVNCRLNPNSKS